MNHPASQNIGATNNLALISLTLAISFLMIGPLGSLPAIICGNLAMRRYREYGIMEGRGMARAGIILGWIGLSLFLVVLVLSLVVAGAAFTTIQEIFDTIRTMVGN